MPITISQIPADAMTPKQVQTAIDNSQAQHVECGNQVRLLDSGKVQCLACLKVGHPHAA